MTVSEEYKNTGKGSAKRIQDSYMAFIRFTFQYVSDRKQTIRIFRCISIFLRNSHFFQLCFDEESADMYGKLYYWTLQSCYDVYEDKYGYAGNYVE